MYDDDCESYYDSDDWIDERNRALDEWNGACEHCGEGTSSPHVHHVYGLGSSVYSILCPECHAEHHGDPSIAKYQKKYPKCKYCGELCEWKKDDGGRWILLKKGTSLRHNCQSKPPRPKFWARKPNGR